MAGNAQAEHGPSWLERTLDKIKPQPAPPPSPWPPPVDRANWEHSVEAHKINTLTVHDVGLIVFNETQSGTHSDKANDTIGGAREKVVHAVINADSEFGRARPKTAPAVEPSAKVMRDPRTKAAYDSSLRAAREAYLSPTDPTQGASYFNLRRNADRSDYEPGGPHGPQLKIRTQSGPFDNSYPTAGKRGLPSHGIYINTYGPD